MNTWFSNTKAWALELTRIFSQTDTPGETAFGAFLHARLAALPYFQHHPQHLRLERTHSDARERSAVLALVRGAGPQTLILTGHYDVVGVENYGPLAEWACDPEALLPRLTAQLKEESAQGGGLSPADNLALQDLESGDFLPGRGLLDMKSGLAAGLAVLERFSQVQDSPFPGSLLFIAVPDEEIASNGARTAGALLPALAQEWGLHIEGAINLDASDDPGDGTHGQSAYLGSVGKLLPSAFLVGRETHAGSPFSGINANLLAAELTRRIECNPALSDCLDGECSSPPTCLKQADTKAHYDVTTPTTAWCYYNWLILQRPASSVLESLRALAGEALEAALESVRASAGQFAGRSSQPASLPDWRPQVYTFAEVKVEAARRGGEDFQWRLEELEAGLAADPALDTPTCCLRLTEAAWTASGLIGPAAVVGFAAIFYPPVSLDPAERRAQRLHQSINRQAQALSREKNTPILLQPFFPGISDISFLGGRVSPQDAHILASNTPAWRRRAGFEYDGIARLGIPVVNIGPWGRDYHQRIERVHTPYSFEILPEFLWRIVRDLLAEESQQNPA